MPALGESLSVALLIAVLVRLPWIAPIVAVAVVAVLGKRETPNATITAIAKAAILSCRDRISSDQMRVCRCASLVSQLLRCCRLEHLLPTGYFLSAFLLT
jgi:hypothetical protein